MICVLGLKINIITNIKFFLLCDFFKNSLRRVGFFWSANHMDNFKMAVGVERIGGGINVLSTKVCGLCAQCSVFIVQNNILKQFCRRFKKIYRKPIRTWFVDVFSVGL